MACHLLLKKPPDNRSGNNSLEWMRFNYWAERLEKAEEFDDLFTIIGAINKESASLPAEFLNNLYFKFKGKFDEINKTRDNYFYPASV